MFTLSLRLSSTLADTFPHGDLLFRYRHGDGNIDFRRVVPVVAFLTPAFHSGQHRDCVALWILARSRRLFYAKAGAPIPQE